MTQEQANQLDYIYNHINNFDLNDSVRKYNVLENFPNESYWTLRYDTYENRISAIYGLSNDILYLNVGNNGVWGGGPGDITTNEFIDITGFSYINLSLSAYFYDSNSSQWVKIYLVSENGSEIEVGSLPNGCTHKFIKFDINQLSGNYKIKIKANRNSNWWVIAYIHDIYFS